LKLNYIGIVAAVLAFISLALPWWTMSISSTAMGMTYSAEYSVYTYQVRASAMGISQTVDYPLWYGWAALALVALAGISGIVGSVMIDKGKMVLIVSGVLALLSIIIFAVGLQSELSNAAVTPGTPTVGLFSSDSYSPMGGFSMDYSTYLSFGFWLALVAAILAFVSWIKHPTPTPTPPSPKQP